MKTDKALFGVYGRYYNLLYKDKDYEGEARYIQNLLTTHEVSHGELLELGSGTGKHGCLLAEQGYHVHGIERSAEMVTQANTHGRFSCELGDICNIHLGRHYDAVISLFHVISYQTTNDEIHSVFSRAAEHVKAGGLFIFDFWYTPAVLTQRPTVRVKRIGDEQMEITRIAEPVIFHDKNRIDVHYTVYVKDLLSDVIEMITETHSMRHFSLPEIDYLANAHGFSIICFEEFQSGKQPSEDTWGVCAVLKRNQS